MKTRVLLFLALLALAVPASAQTIYTLPLPRSAASVAHAIAEDGDTAMFCKYIGTSACASIAIDAGTGDLTFTDGTCGAESATDTFECPVAAPLGGVIDVSNAACNTMGEVVDIVNASTDWRCQLFEALRTDTSVDALATIAATQATGIGGLALNVDSSVALTQTISITPPGINFSHLSLGPTSTSFKTNPYANSQAVLTAAQSLATYGGGTSLVSVIAVDRIFGASGSETVTTVWPSMVNGATTVRKVFGSCDTPATGCEPAWGPGGLACPVGKQCLVRVTNDNSLSVNTLGINGFWASSPILGGGN